MTTLAELGRGDDARKVADTIDESAEASPAARVAASAAREATAVRERRTFDDKARAAMRKVYLEAAEAHQQKKYEEAKKGFLQAWSLYQPNGQALFDLPVEFLPPMSAHGAIAPDGVGAA